MKTPPICVIRMAKIHWLTAAAILIAVVFVFVLQLIRPMPISAVGYAICLSLAVLYVATGILLWFGNRAAVVLNQICSLPYLTRPRVGQEVWDGIRSAEYREYFK